MDERAEIVVPDTSERRVGAMDSMLEAAKVRPLRWLSLAARWFLIPACLGVLVLILTRLFRVSTSETFDEFTYLRLAVRIFRYHEFESLSSPMVPSLPILLEYWLPALRAASLPESDAWEQEVPGLIRQARLLTSIFVGMPLVWLVYAWLSRRRGWMIGALGGGLVAVSPSVLTASSIATTDACFTLFALLALVAIHRYQLDPGFGSYLIMGLSIGVALAAKQSAAILFVVALIEYLIKRPSRKDGWTWVDHGFWISYRAGFWLTGLISLAFLVDWASYGFALGPTFGAAEAHVTLPVIVPMVANFFPESESIMDFMRDLRPPLAIDTFFGQLDHASRGHPAFLMGQLGFRGWWYFFPVAIGLKSTPAELLMIGLAIFLAFRRKSWRNPVRRLWLSSGVILLTAGMCSSINIGHRYMLFLYPLIILIAADWLGEMAPRWPRRVAASGLLLLFWQATSVAGVAPHYLCYFNSLCGGPAQGYRYLGDSSYDWGQDLPSLRRELEVRGYHKVALSYFGTAKPSIYGIRSIDWMADDEATSTCDWLAISATSLQGVYSSSTELYERFKNVPSSRAGYSIFLYDLNDPQVREAWDAVRKTRGLPPVSALRKP